MNRNLILKFITISLFLFFFSGCMIAAPMHDLGTPETLGPWGVRAGVMAGTAPAFATPKATTSVITKNASTPIAGYYLDIGLPSNLQLGFEVMGTVPGISIATTLKWQLSGANYFQSTAGNTASAVSFRLWSSAAPDSDLSKITSSNAFANGELHGTGIDLAYSIGKRMTNWFAGYVGTRATTGTVEAKYRATVDGPFVASESRSISGGGAFTGISLSPHGKKIGFDFNLEVNFLYLPATFSDDRVWYTNIVALIAMPFKL